MSQVSGPLIRRFRIPPKRQADLLVTMAPPISGTKYEWSTDGTVPNAVGTKKNIKLLSLTAKVTWTVQPSPLEIHVTIDGIAYIFAKIDPVSATIYYAREYANAAANAQALVTSEYLHERGNAGLLVGRSILVEVETTGGTVQNLDARIKLAQY